MVGYSPWGRKESDMTQQVTQHLTECKEELLDTWSTVLCLVVRLCMIL